MIELNLSTLPDAKGGAKMVYDAICEHEVSRHEKPGFPQNHISTVRVHPKTNHDHGILGALHVLMPRPTKIGLTVDPTMPENIVRLYEKYDDWPW